MDDRRPGSRKAPGHRIRLTGQLVRPALPPHFHIVEVSRRQAPFAAKSLFWRPRNRHSEPNGDSYFL